MANLNYKELTEKGATVAAVLYPMTALPQAVKIFALKDATGLSLLSWIGFALIELVFFAYGIAHGLKPIVLTGVLWIFLYAFIITGIVKYG